MAMRDDQIKTYLSSLRSLSELMTELGKRCSEAKDMWWNRGYNSGGAQEILQADIDGTVTFAGLTVAELTSVISTIEGLVTFIGTNKVNIDKIKS